MKPSADTASYVVRPRLLRWGVGCGLFGAIPTLGLSLLIGGEWVIGTILLLLGFPIAFWMFAYAKPMTIEIGECGFEFRTFGRSIVVPYERLRDVSLVHSDKSLLDYFLFGLRAQGSYISTLWGWYLFIVLFPMTAFFATLWIVDGWNKMVNTIVSSWRFWVLLWLMWSVIFLGVRFLVVPAMKRIRLKDATLMFVVDAQLLTRQPFSYYRSRPICVPLRVITARDREQIATALESHRERLPKDALRVAVLHELKVLSQAAEAASA